MCSYHHKIRQDCQSYWQIIIEIMVILKHAAYLDIKPETCAVLCKQSQYGIVLMFEVFLFLFVSVSVLFG